MGKAVLLGQEPAAHDRITCKRKESDLAELEEHTDPDRTIEHIALNSRAVAFQKGLKMSFVDA